MVEDDPSSTPKRCIGRDTDLRIRLPGEEGWITLAEFARRKMAEGVMKPPPPHPDDVNPNG